VNITLKSNKLSLLEAAAQMQTDCDCDRDN